MQPGSYVENGLNARLKAGEVVGIVAIRLLHGAQVARLVHTAGFGALYVDLEHSTQSLEQAAQICVACHAVGVTPLVRVPANTPDFIARALDGGAMGVIAPHVHTAEEARAVVQLAKYPPLGTRSASSGLPHLHYRSVPAAVSNPVLNAQTTVVAMIESREGLRNVDAIAAVEGVDAILVGTNDLTAELGIPGDYGNPLVRDAYDAVITACQRHDKHAGTGGLSSRQDLVAEFVRAGVRLVSTGMDLGAILDALTRQAKAVAALRT